MIRVRFAPPPTGYLHIGSARTFSRAALTGQPVGPNAFAIFACIGRERAIKAAAKRIIWHA